jgi:hypothetical protein
MASLQYFNASSEPPASFFGGALGAVDVGDDGAPAVDATRSTASPLGDFNLQIGITGRDDIRTATVTKNNDGPEGQMASFRSCWHDFGADEDGDPIEFWLAEPVGGEVPPRSQKQKSDWSTKPLRLLRDVLINALIEAGRDIQPYIDGPTVKAVDKTIVRTEFMKRHHADDDRTKRRAFNRAVEDAKDRKLIALRQVEDIQFIWFASEP